MVNGVSQLALQLRARDQPPHKDSALVHVLEDRAMGCARVLEELDYVSDAVCADSLPIECRDLVPGRHDVTHFDLIVPAEVRKTYDLQGTFALHLVRGDES